MTTVTAEATAPTRLMLFAELVRRHDMTYDWSESPAVRQAGDRERQRLLTMAATLPRGEVLAIVDLRARKAFPLEAEADEYHRRFGQALDAEAGR